MDLNNIDLFYIMLYKWSSYLFTLINVTVHLVYTIEVCGSARFTKKSCKDNIA